MNAIQLPDAWRERVLVVRAEEYEMPQAEEFLSREESAVMKTFRLRKRRDEWLLSRAAFKRLALDAGACESPQSCEMNRPRLQSGGSDCGWFVSISHSLPYAGAIIGRAPVGIDVQVIRDLSESTLHLFVREEEAEDLRRCSIADRVLHYWCAKEAAWKQRSEEFVTMKQVPLELIGETSRGLRFDSVETWATDDVIVAVTVPIS